MIKLGSNSIGKIYLGSNSIGKAYLGSNLVFQKGSSPTPSIQPVFYSYLIFDGDSGIATDIVPPANASFRAGLGSESSKTAQGVFSIGTASTGRIRLFLGGGTTSTMRNLAVDYDSTSYVGTDSNLAFTNDRYSFFMTPSGFGYGTTFHSFTKGSTHPDEVLVIGSEASNLRYTGAVGYFRIYDSNAASCQSVDDFDSYTPLYYLRPCTYNGEAGLWCVETSTFYGKTVGDGTLTVSNSL